jgi:hypothetical protein
MFPLAKTIVGTMVKLATGEQLVCIRIVLDTVMEVV